MVTSFQLLDSALGSIKRADTLDNITNEWAFDSINFLTVTFVTYDSSIKHGGCCHVERAATLKHFVSDPTAEKLELEDDIHRRIEHHRTRHFCGITHDKKLTIAAHVCLDMFHRQIVNRRHTSEINQTKVAQSERVVVTTRRKSFNMFS